MSFLSSTFIDPVSNEDTSIIIRNDQKIIVYIIETKRVANQYVSGITLVITYRDNPNSTQIDFNDSIEANAGLIKFRQALDITKQTAKTQKKVNNIICIDYLTFRNLALNNNVLPYTRYMVKDTQNTLLLGINLNYIILTTSEGFYEGIFELESDGRLYKVFLDKNQIVSLCGTKVFQMTSSATTWTITHNLYKYPTVRVTSINEIDTYIPKIIFYPNDLNKITLDFGVVSIIAKAFLN